jgi:hypothetical protein
MWQDQNHYLLLLLLLQDLKVCIANALLVHYMLLHLVGMEPLPWQAEIGIQIGAGHAPHMMLQASNPPSQQRHSSTPLHSLLPYC